jgi:hypothetical protein
MTNFVCSSWGCDYTTNVEGNLTIEQLEELVEEDGGYVLDSLTLCPKCKCHTLIYEAK